MREYARLFPRMAARLSLSRRGTSIFRHINTALSAEQAVFAVILCTFRGTLGFTPTIKKYVIFAIGTTPCHVRFRVKCFSTLAL
jgi:hypothetical protein